MEAWLQELADRTPTPGGGGAAGLTAAISAALVGMVTAYTTGERWQDREARMRELNAQAAELRAAALALVGEDEAAFAAVGAAYRMPRSTEAEKSERATAIQVALVEAAQPPVGVARVARRLVDIAGELVESGNRNVVSDVGVASAAAHAALQAAVLNIEINLRQITDPQVGRDLRAEVAAASEYVERAGAVTERVRKAIAQ
ncbi:MAG: formiminotransferase-cyclodeaminase [Streptosporangiaceae bacterium]|nr:formiminotransferase-cyclodeaminase [Streptosporangiaceae bacterium]